jgi:hypothetical protein
VTYASLIRIRTVALVALALAACTATLPGTPLAIDTAGFHLVPGSCAGVGVPPFRIERHGDALLYVDVGTALARKLVWPSGFAARLVSGTAILYAGNGSVVGRENDVIENAGGCPQPDGSIVVDEIGQSSSS